MDSPVRPFLAQFLRRLMRHSPLTCEDQDAVLALPGMVVRITHRRDLIHPGRPVRQAILVGDGLLGRFDLLRNGSRQITAIHVAGDMADLHTVVAPTPGWGVAVFAPSVVVRVEHADLQRVATECPNVGLAFWRDTTLDASLLAKSVANIGRKSADGRLAHFLCEYAIRSEWAGRGDRHRSPFPMTQEQIGDTLGLTAVHVNRTMAMLRERGLAVVRERHIDILDWRRLVDVAEFDQAYLLGGPAEMEAR